MAKKIELPFQPEFKESMLSGKKTTTTRPTRYGYPGDQFEAFGRVFILTEVYPSFLDVVVSLHYSEEGFNSRQEFIECWDRIHLYVTFAEKPDRPVYLHRFMKKQNEYAYSSRNG